VRIWDVAERKLLRTLAGYSRGVTDVAFHPGGRRLATTNPGEPVKLWDAQTGQELLALPAEAELITRLSFSADGTVLRGSSSTGLVRVWEAPPQRPEVRP
jgi:WD40 repeat protein